MWRRGEVRIKTTYKLLFLFLLLSLLSFPFLTKSVTAIQTIYILANGTIQPEGALITRTGNIFTLTGNITADSIDGIVIQRNNTILEGADYTITGNMLTGSHGIVLDRTKNVTVKNIVVKSFKTGIYGNVTSNSYITEANLTNNDYGIRLSSSDNNTIDRNNITQSTWAGIWLQNSKNNYISRNKMTNSTSSTLSGIRLEDFSDNNNITSNYLTNCTNYGIYLDNCASNRIFHNSFISAGWAPAFIGSDVYTLYWDDGYPSGGNYWSDYFGVDSFSGPYQNETGKDGMGDTPHVIVGSNRDKYPLMNPWTAQETTVTVNGTVYPVTMISNATIVRIDNTPDNLNFTVSGSSPQRAYVRVICPKEANSTNLRVFINDTVLTPPFPVITSNATKYFIYFEFLLSPHQILMPFVIDEYMFGVLLALASCFAAYGIFRKHGKTHGNTATTVK
jgi:parallel beta-helix repeat protein